MPKSREFTLSMQDRPGVLGKTCRALADRGVNIVGFQSFAGRSGESQVRLVTDNPTITKSVLESQGLTFAETDVVEVKLPHRPGELARAATRLGEANININYTYCGAEPGTNAPLVFFGVAEIGQAVPILERASSAAAGT
jgi:hypothetical protein